MSSLAESHIPLLFDEYCVKNNLVSGLTESMESTLEFESKNDEPLDKIIEAYQKMTNLGIEFDIDFQKTKECYLGNNPKHDFFNKNWIKKNLEIINNNKKLKM